LLVVRGQDSIRFIPTAVGNAYWRFRGFYGIAVHPHGCGERVLFLFDKI